MKRDAIVIELQKRLSSITTGNGHPITVTRVDRNPDGEPNVERMPLIHLFELTDAATETRSRGASAPPKQKRELTVVLELWRASTSDGKASKDILEFLKSSREVIFSDGITLGRVAAEVVEEELSRVFRPGIGNNVAGIGQVLKIKYIEDFANL